MAKHWRFFAVRSSLKGPSVEASALIALALAILLFPIRWIGAWMLAVLVHEVCHYAAVRACGGVVSGIRLGVSGAKMDIWGLGYWQEVFCALAGPLGGICLLAMVQWLPRTAICALVQSLFNLLPVYPLDGGRALRCVFHGIFPASVADRIWNILQKGCLICLVGLGVYSFAFLRAGLIPLALSIILAFRWFSVNRPCINATYSLQ